ncbi:Endonuclease III [bacterium HR23]|nr:Endonuclease III [bacterium HR23]
MEPVDELVFTILTQHTSDVNGKRAFERLKARFPHWEEVLDAPLEAIEEAIRSAGLSRQKAPRIQQALRTILERRGRLDLAFLQEMPLAEAKAWLRSLPGVGPKTSAIVLCFALGLPAMPVDTHVHRVARRLGLLGPRDNADKAHDLLEGLVEPEEVYPFHVYLITHGRRVCKARGPRCGECVLRDICPSRQV